MSNCWPSYPVMPRVTFPDGTYANVQSTCSLDEVLDLCAERLSCLKRDVLLMVLPSSDDESRPLVIGIAADVTLRHLWDLPELKLHNKTPQRESALQRLKVLLRPALTRFAPLQAELAQFTTSHEVSATSVAVERLVVPALFQVRTLTDRSMDVSLVLFRVDSPALYLI